MRLKEDRNYDGCHFCVVKIFDDCMVASPIDRPDGGHGRIPTGPPGSAGDTVPTTGKPIIFTCVSYAEARNSYRLDVRPSVRPSVRHTLAPYQNG